MKRKLQRKRTFTLGHCPNPGGGGGGLPMADVLNFFLKVVVSEICTVLLTSNKICIFMSSSSSKLPSSPSFIIIIGIYVLSYAQSVVFDVQNYNTDKNDYNCPNFILICIWI